MSVHVGRARTIVYVLGEKRMYHIRRICERRLCISPLLLTLLFP